MSSLIPVPSRWRNNDTGEVVEAYWCSDVLVSYAKDEPKEVRTVRTERQFKFLQEFTQEI